MPQSNGNLSGMEVAGYLHAAGFSGADLQTAVAIAMAESSWNPKAYNPAAGGNYGLMQINSVHNPTQAEKTEPFANSKKAFKVYRQAGNSFKPWEVYTTSDPKKSYKRYMEIARQSVTGLKSAGPQFERDLIAGKNPGSDANPIKLNDPTRDGALNLPGNPVAGVEGAIASAASTLAEQGAKFGSNIIGVIVGIVLIVLGIAILIRHTAFNVPTLLSGANAPAAPNPGAVREAAIAKQVERMSILAEAKRRSGK